MNYSDQILIELYEAKHICCVYCGETAKYYWYEEYYCEECMVRQLKLHQLVDNNE